MNIKAYYKILTTVSITIMCISGIAAAAEAGSSLVGTWHINVQGDRCANAQTVNIATATKTKVLGTTNVGDGYGKIVGGSFDGVSAAFTNKFVWEGARYTENWTATVTQGGNRIKGTYKNTAAGYATCRYSGSRQ